MSVRGNHCISILKVSESNCDELLCGLKDIINEARDLQCITVVDMVFQLEYYLGGDMKFWLWFVGLKELHVNTHAYGASAQRANDMI